MSDLGQSFAEIILPCCNPARDIDAPGRGRDHEPAPPHAKQIADDTNEAIRWRDRTESHRAEQVANFIRVKSRGADNRPRWLADPSVMPQGLCQEGPRRHGWIFAAYELAKSFEVTIRQDLLSPFDPAPIEKAANDGCSPLSIALDDPLDRLIDRGVEGSSRHPFGPLLAPAQQRPGSKSVLSRAVLVAEKIYLDSATPVLRNEEQRGAGGVIGPPLDAEKAGLAGRPCESSGKCRRGTANRQVQIRHGLARSSCRLSVKKRVLEAGCFHRAHGNGNDGRVRRDDRSCHTGRGS